MWRKYDRKNWIRITIAFLFLLSITTASLAQEIIVDPHAITFNSTSGDTVTRTVIVSATDNLTGLKFIANDLFEISGARVIPQQAIFASEIPSQMKNGSIEQIPITFNLINVQGGLYTGEVWLASSSDGVTKIPVTATIKADLLWPLLILILGILISYALFYYASRLKNLDEIWKSLGIIEEMVKIDTELKEPVQYDREDRVPHERCNPLYDQIRTDIERLKAKLRLGIPSDADAAYKELQKDWDDWINSRDQLVFLFDKFGDYIGKLNVLEQQILAEGREIQDGSKNNHGTVPPIEECRQRLQAKFDGVRKDTEQKNLEQALKAGLDFIEKIQMVLDTINVISSTCDNIEKLANKTIYSPDTIDSENLRKLKDRITKVCPNKKWDALKSCKCEDIEEFKKEVDKTLEDAESLEADLTKIDAGKYAAENQKVKRSRQPHVPLEFGELPPVQHINQSQWASYRLVLYNIGDSLITVIILALIGFSQLYLSNPTFGASIENYVTLGLWGLLAGSTGQAIVQKVQGPVVV